MWNWRWLIGLALVLSAGVGIVRADDAPLSPQNPISGRVVEISLVGDLFLHLDTDGDGIGDIWAKIEDDSELVDVNGQPVSPSQITVGTLLLLTRYKFEETYYEIIRAVVGEGELSGSGTLSGRIALAFAFGENTFVELDTDGDGRGDLPLKVKQSGLITDAQGRALGAEGLQSGVLLRLISYTRGADGFYVTWHVIVGEGDGGATPLPLVAGRVVERHALGSWVFVRLDPDGDGPGEWLVRLGPQTELRDRRDRRRSLDALQVDDHLEVPGYTFIEGYFDARRALLGP